MTEEQLTVELQQLLQLTPRYEEDKEEHLTPDERNEMNALLVATSGIITEKQWRERRLKMPKRHEPEKWNLVKAYALSPTQELASQLLQMDFDKGDLNLFRLHELEKKKNPMLTKLYW